jgi:hypothetical protein
VTNSISLTQLLKTKTELFMIFKFCYQSSMLNLKYSLK